MSKIWWPIKPIAKELGYADARPLIRALNKAGMAPEIRWNEEIHAKQSEVFATENQVKAVLAELKKRQAKASTKKTKSMYAEIAATETRLCDLEEKYGISLKVLRRLLKDGIVTRMVPVQSDKIDQKLRFSCVDKDFASKIIKEHVRKSEKAKASPKDIARLVG